MSRLIYLPIAFICFVFVQSLFFKFTGSEETVIIFSTIGAWMANIGLPSSIANGFANYGGWAVGLTELVACVLLIIPKTRLYGALLAFGLMCGAIFFHLGTPLGVDRVVDAEGNTDNGLLFVMACGVWLCALIVAVLRLVGFRANAA